MNTSIVLWTCSAPDPLTDALVAAGYRVWEALILSEVTYLCETQNIGAVVIKADVDRSRAAELAQHVITLRMEPQATATEVIETLWHLFPAGSATIQ